MDQLIQRFSDDRTVGKIIEVNETDRYIVVEFPDRSPGSGTSRIIIHGKEIPR